MTESQDIDRDERIKTLGDAIVVNPVAELERRLERLERYIAQLKAHGHLPAMRDDQ
jgi:hypothetical protein